MTLSASCNLGGAAHSFCDEEECREIHLSSPAASKWRPSLKHSHIMKDQSQRLADLQGKRAGIYCRAQGSSENIKKSLLIQFDQAEKLCATRRWIVTGRYHDVGSANYPLSRRPGLSKAMEDGGTNVFEVLVVEDWDRLSRNFTNGEQIFTFFTNCGVSIFSFDGGCGEDAQLRCLSPPLTSAALVLRRRNHTTDQ
jgi:hypothetical protein